MNATPSAVRPEAALAAHQPGAADDDRDDRVEAEAASDVRLGRGELADDDDRAQADHQAHEHEHEERVARHVDAGPTRRGRIAAHGVRVAAHPRARQEQPAHDVRDHDDGRGDA